MSLDRYTNSEELKTINEPATGQLFSTKELQSLQNSLYIPKFTQIGDDLSQLISEAHIYSIEGDYVISTYNKHPILNSQPDSPYSIFFDVRDVFRHVGISRGSYKVVFNLLSSVFGKPNGPTNYPLIVKEISPDRTEIQVSLKDPSSAGSLRNLENYVNRLRSNGTLNNLVLNFNSNRINKILNFRRDRDDATVAYFKVHLPIDETVESLDYLWVGYELIDSHIDSFILTSKTFTQPLNQLKGPKFDIDIDVHQSQATIYKSWDDLLQSDIPTTQRILDTAFSASSQAILNIDYSEWDNFIFYSSAEERFSNFHYKMGLVESYSIDNSTLNSIASSGSLYVINNISSNQNKINSILESFDSFERWLYYSPTGSIFTHDITGSLSPWPKFESDSKQINYSATSSIVTEWYQQNLVSAAEYDETNYNSLWWSIPEHILMDENNSEYQLFIQMIGHHFDNLYMYVKALTQIHERDEHPQRGPSNDLLPYIAKSFGWNLQNVRQLSDLWLYKLGTNSSGSFVDSPDFRTSPHREQTDQVWRRIVNNLPFLLKTKGTARSVKAMMSIYGIPQSFISIKEYGGPGIDNDLPVLIEDTYGYKLNISSESYLRIPQDSLTATLDGWGNLSVCDIVELPPVNTRKPDTYEFRFSTEQSASLGAIPIFTITSGSGIGIFPKLSISLVSHKELDVNNSSSYSGSEAYGKVLLEIHGSSSYAPNYAYSDYLPIFDGDLWTVRIYEGSPGTIGDEKRVTIAKASDSLYGRISHKSTISASYNVMGVFDSAYLGGGPAALYSRLDYFTNTPHSFSNLLFSGSVQGYKEYFTTYSDSTFYNHVRNPRAYNVDSISGSYYSLYRYHPLGLDVQREDHSIVNFISSSHPDRSKTPSLTEFVNFSGDQYSQYTSVNETFYSVTPQIAGQTLGNEKIRLEDSVLKFELAPDARGEKSEYDEKPNDRNRLAIVFSTSDQINRDIANHMGAANFEEWIADPELEFGVSYPLLNWKSQEYFQKYQKKYDVNSFIRILSVYDYTFFEQIKQLVPGRADLIAGILIEPHMLQRSKVQISRLPKVTNPQWSDTIVYMPTQSAAYITHDSEIIFTGSSDIETFYKTASVEYERDVNINPYYKTGSIPFESPLKEGQYYYSTSSIPYESPLKEATYITVASSSLYLNPTILSPGLLQIITSSILMPWRTIDLDAVRKYEDQQASASLAFESGSGSKPDSPVIRPTVATIDVPTTGSGHTYNMVTSSFDLTHKLISDWLDTLNMQIQIVNKYDGFKSGSLNLIITQSVPDCRYQRKKYHYDAYLPSQNYFSQSWYASTGTATVEPFNGSITNIIKDKLKTSIRFSTGTVLEQKLNLQSGSRFILDLYAMPTNTSSFSEFNVKVFETANPSNERLNKMIRISYGKDSGNEWVNRYKFDFDSVGLMTINITVNSQVRLFPFASGLYDYLTPWEESWIRVYNSDNRLHSTATYETWYYQYNECSAVNRLRFSGCKLEGPGINIDSPNTIDGGPVVEIRQANPNLLSINPGNSDGNLRIE